MQTQTWRTSPVKAVTHRRTGAVYGIGRTDDAAWDDAVERHGPAIRLAPIRIEDARHSEAYARMAEATQ